MPLKLSSIKSNLIQVNEPEENLSWASFYTKPDKNGRISAIFIMSLATN